MPNNHLVVFSGNSNIALAKKICKYLDVKLGQVMVDKFSEGEVRVMVEQNVRGTDVFVVQSTSAPVNENLMELLIMIDALKRASAKRITAVLPHYGYARQDRKDRPRVPIAAKLVANLLTVAGADRVLTLDLHAGQIQGFFDIPLDHLFAVNVFVDYLKKKKLKDMIVVSPDVGGIKMARAYSKRLKAELAVIDKRRLNDKETVVMNILGPAVKGRDVVIVDDIVATAGSLVEAVAALKDAGARDVYAAITHPVLSGPAIDRVKKSLLKELLVTDSIPISKDKLTSKIKVLSVSDILGEAIKRIHNEESVSSLFD